MGVSINEWLVSPLSIIAALAVLAAIWKCACWFAKIDRGHTDFRELVKEIRNDIKEIFKRLPSPEVKSASPVTLTEFGEKIAASFGASAWAKQIAPTIVGSITGKAAFEIDEFCQAYVKDELNDAKKSEVSRVAYEFGIEHQKVLNVLRVVLRDELIQIIRSTG